MIDQGLPLFRGAVLSHGVTSYWEVRGYCKAKFSGVAGRLGMAAYVALDDRASRFGEWRMPVKTIAHQGQSAMGGVDFGSGLLESESTHEP
jgi:hypothetical protein